MTVDQKRLLVIVAHPDDETFGTGSVIATASAAGVDVTVCCATRGEAGEVPAGFDGDVASLREAELRAAGAVLGVKRFILLDFVDSGMVGTPAPNCLAAANARDVVGRLDEVIDDVEPQTVVTLDPDSGDGHRDHTVIGRAAIDSCSDRRGLRVYVWALPRRLLARWFLELERLRPGSEHLNLDRSGLGRPDSEITTVVDASSVLDVRERAIALHASQVSPYDGMPADLRADFLATDRFVRVVPAWTGGAFERSIFESENDP